MTVPSDAARHGAAPSLGIRVAAGLFGGSALLAAVDAGAIALSLPLPSGGMSLRLAHHLFDAAETLGVGALAGGAALAFFALARPPRWAAALVAAATTAAIVRRVIGEDLTRLSSLTLEGRHEQGLFAGYLIVLGALLPAAFVVAGLCARRRWLGLAVVVFSLGVMAGDHLLLADDYFGTHGVVAWGAAVLGGGAAAPFVERAGRALAAGRRSRIALAAVALFALFGVAVPPSNAVRCELFRNPCAVAPWVLSLVWRAPRLHGPVPPLPPSPWFEDRSGLPPVPPAGPRLLPKDAVVVLVTIDAVRADAIEDPANLDLFPTFSSMKREGVHFTRAYAPGTQTALSLSTIFSGRYFSEVCWTDHGEGRTRYLYPSCDTSVRFPEVLAEHGVATANFASLIFLANDYGVLRGFREETVTVTGWRHAGADEVVNPLVDRLAHHGATPIFLYAHLMEPHDPYDRGREDGTARERWLSEVSLADERIGRIRRYLEARFPRRWALFVTSDHGEAFGDHRTYTHGKTLYDELLHVPLLVQGPAFTPRTVEDAVGLIDLGPTILDLFGLFTPPTFLGQSLVPLLDGRTASLTRPLVAEGRLRRALTSPDGLKVIEDERRKVVEVYDLFADPGERRNLFDLDPGRSDPALAALRTFFAAHIRTEGGDWPQYKP
jgi:arylsulfatase A-like enzyme